MTTKTKTARKRRAIRKPTVASKVATANATKLRAEPRSVIPAEFRARYKELGGFADDFGRDLTAYLRNGDGKAVDAAKLRALATANGIDFGRYAALNPGQQRMNVGNRLRALVRKGGKVLWPGAKAAPKKRGRPRKTRTPAEA